MKPEDYSERKADLNGWEVSIVTYRLDSAYHTTVENIDPGAWVVRGEGQTRDEAEAKALHAAEVLLNKIKKMPPPTGCISTPGS